MKNSPYMNWSKLRPALPYDLALSGVIAYPLEQLPIEKEQVVVTGQSMYGYEPLQRAIAERYGVTPDHVVAANGCSGANHLAMAALIEPGDQVLMEYPVYDPILSVAHYLRADITRFHRRRQDGFRLNVAEVARHIGDRTKLIVITNLHNPTSTLTGEEELRELGAAAQRVGARILVDEVYQGTLFENEPPSSVHLGPEFVVTNSLTKAYGLAGLRCGWILAEPELAQKMWRLNDLFGVSQPHAAELLAVIAFENLTAIAQRAHDLLDRNRALLNDFLATRTDLELTPAKFGTTIFPRWPNRDVDRLAGILRDKYQTAIVPGRFFEMRDHFRVGICGATESVAGGLERLGQALNEL